MPAGHRGAARKSYPCPLRGSYPFLMSCHSINKT
nr:MAG TPA: hypothetical protein [Caudoviricetes sp.]